jgi:FkbM family methyltransferase
MKSNLQSNRIFHSEKTEETPLPRSFSAKEAASRLFALIKRRISQRVSPNAITLGNLSSCSKINPHFCPCFPSEKCEVIFEQVLKPDLAICQLTFKDFSLSIADYVGSSTPRIVRRELVKNRYNIESIEFSPNDIVIDIGAHVGVVSIYIAKRFPFVKIYAYEPIPDNYEHLVINLKANGVNNVTPHNLAITSDGRKFDMIVNFTNNSGGGTGHLRNMNLHHHFHYTVESVTLDSVFEEYNIGVCKLLKIDCEGTEHEILWNTRYLNRIEYLSGEFHINRHLAEQGYSIDSLISHCRTFVHASKLRITSVRMAE